jgi:tetratricopeptide (TPR) repeat protein
VHTNLGEVSFAEGRYEDALLQWLHARKMYQEMDDGQGIAESQLQLAQVHLALGDTASAANALDEAESVMKERRLDTFTPQLLYLRGLHLLALGTYEAARHFFVQAGGSAPQESERERGFLLKVRMAECDLGLGKHDTAASLALAARDAGEKLNLPHIAGEASFVLGMIAKKSPDSVAEKSLAIFRRGFDRIAGEPVTEVTWKLAFVLGQEFRQRGQGVKAQECFMNARLILQFFLSQFSSSELKNSYLAVDDKKQVIAALDSYLPT